MNLDDRHTKCANDPKYRAAAAELKLTLDLANRILDLRIERGWSQVELGAMLGASAGFVDGLESGTISPTVKTLEVLAAALGVKLRVGLG